MNSAGRLCSFREQWIRSFGHSWASSIVSQGYYPEWNTIPPLHYKPLSRRKYSTEDLIIFQTEIRTLLDINAIQELDPSVPCFTSELFLVPKKQAISDQLSICEN